MIFKKVWLSYLVSHLVSYGQSDSKRSSAPKNQTNILPESFDKKWTWTFDGYSKYATEIDKKVKSHGFALFCSENTDVEKVYKTWSLENCIIPLFFIRILTL